MKAIALTTALVAALSAPAFAGSQLEQDLGVDHGVYSATQLVALKNAAEQTGNDARVYFGDNGSNVLSSSNAKNTVAERIFAEINAAGVGEGRFLAKAETRNVVVSDGAANARAAAIIASSAVPTDGPNS